jgi:hypothetical protein
MDQVQERIRVDDEDVELHRGIDLSQKDPIRIKGRFFYHEAGHLSGMKVK